MKTQLTAEQSANLISKGVSAEIASKRIFRQATDGLGRPLEKSRLKRWKDCMPHEKSEGRLKVGLTRFEDRDIFTLSDLIALLPKEIESGNYKCGLSIWRHPSNYWLVSYIKYSGAEIQCQLMTRNSDELIDALYELALYCIDNNCLNKG